VATVLSACKVRNSNKQATKHAWDGKMCISVQRYDSSIFAFQFYLKMFITSSQKAFQNYKKPIISVMGKMGLRNKLL
jgi:hypothetical protein